MSGSRGGEANRNQIVIVGIDQPPLPRPDYAQVLDHVRAGSPRAIIVDDNELLAAIARNGPVLLATTRDGPEGPITVPAGVPDAPGAIIASDATDKEPRR